MIEQQDYSHFYDESGLSSFLFAYPEDVPSSFLLNSNLQARREEYYSNQIHLATKEKDGLAAKILLRSFILHLKLSIPPEQNLSAYAAEHLETYLENHTPDPFFLRRKPKAYEHQRKLLYEEILKDQAKEQKKSFSKLLETFVDDSSSKLCGYEPETIKRRFTRARKKKLD